MPVPDLHERQIARWCRRRVPEHALNQVRVDYTMRDSTVTILELRAPSRTDIGPDWTTRPIAQLRGHEGRWKLYWPDRNNRWHRLDDVPEALSPAPLLTAIDQPHRAFW